MTALFHAIHLRNSQRSVVALAKLPKLEADTIPSPSRPGLGPNALEAEAALQVFANVGSCPPVSCLGTTMCLAAPCMLQGEYVFSLSHTPPTEVPLPPINSALRDEAKALKPP